jgi:hypothetical protein
LAVVKMAKMCKCAKRYAQILVKMCTGVIKRWFSVDTSLRPGLGFRVSGLGFRV